MKQLTFIGDIIKIFFDRNIYANINMSQANGIIPLQFYVAANPELLVRMHHRV